MKWPWSWASAPSPEARAALAEAKRADEAAVVKDLEAAQVRAALRRHREGNGWAKHIGELWQ